MRRREIKRIELRHVRREIHFRRERTGYAPSCRGRRKDCRIYPDWNLRYTYVGIAVRGGAQSLYWCDTCLPRKYRLVADSMLRGDEQRRVLEGDAQVAVPPPEPASKEPGSTIPWRQLLT